MAGVTVLHAGQQAPAFDIVLKDLMSAGGSVVNAWADVDVDGDPDLFVGFGGAPNRLYRNDSRERRTPAGVGSIAFTDTAATLGIADARATRAAAWGDYDADGDPDLLVGFAPGGDSVLVLYRNDRTTMVPVTAAAGLVMPTGAVRQPSWIDIDADGDLDLFVAFRDRANALFVNTGGQFVDAAPKAGLADTRKSVGAVWFDHDEDGDLDLYLANMDGDTNALYRNDGGLFTDVGAELKLEWGGRAPGNTANGTVRPCVADVNRDSRLDLFTANYGPNGLFLNLGKAGFQDVSKAWGIAVEGRYDACAFADFDHDGHEDFYVNGTVTGGVSYPDYLYRNTGTGFVDVTPDTVRALQGDHGAAWADADGDGILELALTGTRADGMHFILRNRLAATAKTRAVRVRVVDSRGRAVRQGAEVRVYIARTRWLLGTRLVDTGSGYDAQNDLPVHVGVGVAQAVDIEVTLPRSGRPVTRMTNVDTFKPATVIIRTK